MASVNKIILIGNLGRDPELKYTTSGVAMCKFSIATTEKWKDQEHTEWHRIVTWRKLAEICGEYLSKGRQVYVEGKIRTRSYEQDGVKKYMTEIQADEVKFLGSRGDGGSRGGGGGMGGPRPSGGGADAEPDFTDDDIPF